eukprot:COSAG06_NODE_81_length_25302_cov_21.168902_23_plen_89_part_00
MTDQGPLGRPPRGASVPGGAPAGRALNSSSFVILTACSLLNTHQDQSVRLPRRLDRRRWLDWWCRKAAFAVPRAGAAGRAPHFTRRPW